MLITKSSNAHFIICYRSFFFIIQTTIHVGWSSWIFNFGKWNIFLWLIKKSNHLIWGSNTQSYGHINTLITTWLHHVAFDILTLCTNWTFELSEFSVRFFHKFPLLWDVSFKFWPISLRTPRVSASDPHCGVYSNKFVENPDSVLKLNHLLILEFFKASWFRNIFLCKIAVSYKMCSQQRKAYDVWLSLNRKWYQELLLAINPFPERISWILVDF